jgi:outer membrane protein
MKMCILMLTACYCAIATQAQETTARIGSVDIRYIVTRLPETKAGETELASLQQQYRKQLESKVRAFQVELESIRHRYHGVSMPDSSRRTLERDLQQKQAGIEKAQQEAIETLEQKKTALATAVLKKIQQAVLAVSQKERMDFMLRAENVLYGDAAFDMTFAVLTTLGVVFSEAEKQQYRQTQNNLDGWRSIGK